MNKLERFRAVLGHEPVDRVPAGFWHHFPPAYHGGQAMADRHLRYYRETGLDIMKVMNDTGYRPVGTTRIQSAKDWRQLAPTLLGDPLFQSHIDGLRAIVEALGDEVPIMTTAFNPYNQAVAIVRASDPQRCPTSAEARAALLDQARTEPEPVLEGIGVIAQDLASFYQACIRETGIQGIYYSAQGGEREAMTDEEHARFVKPFDLTVLEALDGVAEFVVGHFCGKAINLRRFVDYPVQMANWAHQSGNASLTEGKVMLGGMPILGGLDERGPLVYGPRDSLRTEIAAALEEMGTRGFMLGAGCTVPEDVDISNLVYAQQVVGELSAA